MKKIFTVVFILIGVKGIGQIANYTFSQSASTYTALTSPTTIFAPIWDDGVSAPITIPFTFNFGNANYTSCRVSTNGFITFGTTAPADDTYAPILSTENYAGAISALGMDLYSNGGSGGNISYKTLNSAPNRIFVIQWTNAYRYSISGSWNFQIRLNESTNIIDIIYGGCTASNKNNFYLAQIGLRGTTNTDFNDLGLPTNTAWLNNVTNIGTLNSTGVQTRNNALPASGTKFTWTPPASWACTPTHDYDDDENIITLVQFVGMVTDASNNSGNVNTSAYQDFTGLTSHASQEQGEAVNLNVFANTSSTLWNAWVDWNQDGDFNDPGEEVYNTNGTYTVSTSFGFQIPLSTPPGDYRIRIRTADYIYGNLPVDYYSNSDILPCNNLADGQAEDYIFTVIARCNAGVDSTKNDTACVTGSAVFTLSAYGNAQATGFKWYSSQFGNTYLASGNTYTTPSLNSTTTYWVAATGLNTQGGACESQTRVPAIAFKPTVPTISFNQSDPSYICNGDKLSVTGTSSSETGYLIKEGFEDGTLGSEFTVTNNISPNGVVTGSMPWHIESSVYVPITSAVWRPAISSGFGSNNFAFALSDTNYMEIDPWNYRTYHTFLTSQPHNTTGYTNLNLSFKLYFDHYLADNVEDELDTVTVQASINGTTWNTIDKFIADQGEASDFKSYNYILAPGTYLGQANVQVRFVFGATWTNGVAIDSIVLYGEHPASSAYTWAQVGGYVDPQFSCLYTNDVDTTGNSYQGGSTQSIYLFPTDAQVDDGNPLSFEAKLDLSNGCTAKDTITVNIDDKRWTAGAGTDDWNTNANWCGNQVPKSSDRVTIPDLSPGTIYPVIKLNVNAKSKYLTIDPNASVTIDSGGYLQIKRDLFTDVGAIFTNNGTVNFNGIYKNGVAQNFPGPGTIAEMNNLTIGNSGTPPAGSSNVILNAPISIRGGLKDSLGTLELGDNDITLKSHSTGTGFIDTIYNSTAGFNLSGTGRFVVERFIPARRAWRFLTVPMYSTTQTISQAWQEGQENLIQPTSCPVPVPPGLEHYGMFITNTQPPKYGYDWNTTNNPSLKYWGNNDWAAPSGTDISIMSYPAYCVFVRGDRQICIQYATSAIPDSTVLRVRGILNEPGNSTGLNYNNSVSRNYTGAPGDMIFVGNPFAASVDISTVLKNSRSPGIVSQKAWFWDPNSNGPSGYNVGAYVTFSGTVWTMPNSSTFPQDLILRSGEAFFVQLATGQTSASINFKQNDKIPASESGIFGPKSFIKKTQEPRVLYVNLLSNNDSASAIVDGVATAFGKNYSADIDDRDAVKMWNMDESMALYRDNKFLSIEFRPMPKLTDTLFYKMYLYKEHSYTIQIFTQNLPGPKPIRAWLIDKYLGTQSEINLHDTLLYNFTSTDDTTSYRDRFMIVFNKQLSTIPVPVSKTTNQQDPNTIGINSGALKSKISISPNPVTSAKNALLLFDNVAKGNYEIIVYSSKGEKLAVKQVQHAGNVASYSLPQGNAWTAGVYMVRVVSEADNRQSADLKLVINR